jgi:hypothetical protein
MKKNYFKPLLFVVFMFTLSFAVFALAQATPPPVAITTAPATSAFKQWLTMIGGLLPAVAAIVVSLNLLFSTIAKICAALQVAEPQWAQNIGQKLGALNAWASANLPTPAPQVQASLNNLNQSAPAQASGPATS